MSDTDFYVPDQVSLKLVPADAALTHESAKTDGCLKGWIPESWCCIDCGFNTAPCLSTRAETEAAFAAGAKDVEQTYNYQTEVYVVREKVWAKSGMEEHGGCLCVGCLEKRIHRRLNPKDFPRNAVLNSPMLPATLRLLKRRFGKHLKVLP